ncbi:hypothetical protein B296_00034896 [Ensete ventricosum]|uniref:Uncharacterized protein n=1 Tax=Ensete ventricosum TaxID=4639 RepID=A0A426YVK3_ENSVE|nr:hypothetical protein B296_00034896 [Ensete ventricosum]
MGTEVLRPQDCLLGPTPGLRSPKPLRRRREGSPKQPTKPRMGRLGPDPVMIPKQIRLKSPAPAMPPNVYAGSAFDLSPSPRALPLPSFSRRKEEPPPPPAKAVVDCSATKDLRRLLRLE